MKISSHYCWGYEKILCRYNNKRKLTQNESFFSRFMYLLRPQQFTFINQQPSIQSSACCYPTATYTLCVCVCLYLNLDYGTSRILVLASCAYKRRCPPLIWSQSFRLSQLFCLQRHCFSVQLWLGCESYHRIIHH